MPEPVHNSYANYVQAGLLGAGRGLLGLVFEHPFDTIKTRCQAHPEEPSVVKVATNIHKIHGFKGFYSGFIPNGVRLAGKQMYRWPMMLGFPPFFQQILPVSLQQQYPTSVKTATALAIANFETLIVCPLERLKVYLMTADHKGKGVFEFLKANKSSVIRALWQGTSAVWARQVTSWVSFLVADEKFKTWERQRIGKKELPFPSLLKVSFCVGAVNTLANMPFDVAKTQLQKDRFMKNEGLFKTVYKIYQSYGVRGLYLGYQVRMAQYMLQSVFTVTLLEKLERSWDKKR